MRADTDGVKIPIPPQRIPKHESLGIGGLALTRLHTRVPQRSPKHESLGMTGAESPPAA